MNDSVFIEELAKIDIYPTSEVLEKLSIYYEELIKYNSHTNLTSITEKKDVYLKHFYDSLTLVKSIDFKGKNKVLDIGSGAGFPGLVLKIFFPEIELVLLDSNRKKTDFLNLMIQKLELSNVEVIKERAEDYVKQARESFDIVTSRAVAKTRVLCEVSLPYLKNNGYLIIMKASDEVTKSELEESKKTINILNSKIERIVSFNLPIENSQRNIIVLKKLDNINIIYPRTYDKILKKPLK